MRKLFWILSLLLLIGCDSNESIFVWTVSDIVGLGVWAIIILFLILSFLYVVIDVLIIDPIKRWLRKRKEVKQ